MKPLTKPISNSEIFQLEVLSDEECWLVLCRMARLEENKVEFVDIGKKIAQKCRGLPLVAKTLGSLLRFKSMLDEWEKALNSEIWEMQEAENEIFRPLLMSYKELSPTQKQCFSYCAVLPKDSEIDVDTLIGNWMALGYLGSNSCDMELKGKECFDILAMRSLFQDFKKNVLDEIYSCKMHDIVHDFAQFLRKSGRVEVAEMNESTPCRACDPSQVFNSNEFCTLYCDEESSPIICNCFVRLRVLRLANGGLHGIDNLIHLRWLDLSTNKLSTQDLKIIFQLYFLQTLNLESCDLEEIPKEIENLYDLRHLDLACNQLKELPSEIGNLKQLRRLLLYGNEFLKKLPSEIGKLLLLQILMLPEWETPCQIPQVLAQLTDLRELFGFKVGNGWSKLQLLKNLNRLRFVILVVRLDGKDLKDVVEDAQDAELRNKIYTQKFELLFEDEIDEGEESSRMDVINALAPHPNVRSLVISGYKGSKLPLWLVSPPNQLRDVFLDNSNFTSFPSLGKLSFLEEIFIGENKELEYIGREFLGITTNTNFVAFPKLKLLGFINCPKLKELEDITAEEEESTSFQVMPGLRELKIIGCSGMTLLPHRLLRKASSLEILDLRCSKKLEQRYGDKDGSDWKFISLNNPRLQLRIV